MWVHPINLGEHILEYSLICSQIAINTMKYYYWLFVIQNGTKYKY